MGAQDQELQATLLALTQSFLFPPPPPLFVMDGDKKEKYHGKLTLMARGQVTDKFIWLPSGKPFIFGRFVFSLSLTPHVLCTQPLCSR